MKNWKYEFWPASPSKPAFILRPNAQWLAAALFLLCGAAALRADETVFLSVDEALRLAFPRSSAVSRETVSLTEAQRSRVEKRLGWRIKETSFDVYKGVNGYAVVTEELGKHEPITFMVKATPDFRAERVDVLVYRERYGGGIQRKEFLSQFRGKRPDSSFRVGKDVVNITGATLSVKAVSAGVKRVLCELEEVYGR